MPADYAIDREKRLVITTVRGSVTLAEVKSHQERLLNDPEFDPTFNQLIDASEMKELLVPAGEGFKLATRAVYAETSRRAVVVKGTGMWRTIAVLLVTYLSMRNESQAFDDMESALKWLDGGQPT